MNSRTAVGQPDLRLSAALVDPHIGQPCLPISHFLTETFVAQLRCAAPQIIVKQEQTGMQFSKAGLFGDFSPYVSYFQQLDSLSSAKIDRTASTLTDQQSQQIKLEEGAHGDFSYQVLRNQEKSNDVKEQESQEPESSGVKNETKNIPKNFGKAIIIFLETNKQIFKQLISANGLDLEELIAKLFVLKKKINSISDLRSLWQQGPESKTLRVISNLFLRKYSLPYIYNSRIRTRVCHSKYRRRLQEAILNPQEFRHIKDY